MRNSESHYKIHLVNNTLFAYYSTDGAIFSLTAAGVDESVLAWTRAAVASPEELASVGWTEGALKKANGLASASRAMFHFSMPVSKENETEVALTTSLLL